MIRKDLWNDVSVAGEIQLALCVASWVAWLDLRFSGGNLSRRSLGALASAESH